MLAYLELVRSWWQDNLSKRPNSIRFSRALYLSNGGVPDRHHGFGTWAKAHDEALVLRFTPPECDYWIFQLCNLWQENFDNYEDGQGHITKYRCTLEPDGSVWVVIADADPGIGGNWIDPGGHVHGGMSLRLILIQAPPPKVTAYLVKLAALARRRPRGARARPGDRKRRGQRLSSAAGAGCLVVPDYQQPPMGAGLHSEYLGHPRIPRKRAHDERAPAAGREAVTESDAFIAQQLEGASIPTLMMSLIHLTGDTSLLRGAIRPKVVMMGGFQGGLSEADQATVRGLRSRRSRTTATAAARCPSSPMRRSSRR